MELIGANYDYIKSSFKAKSYNAGIQFDEDSFNDAFIKCAAKFENAIITLDTTTKYFWTAYLNTCRTNYYNDSKLDTVSLDVEIHDSVDENDNYASNIYNLVMDAVEFKFGRNSMMIYSLYKYHNWSKQDLEDSGYDIENFESHIKEIHKFVKAYCKNHIKNIKRS